MDIFDESEMNEIETRDPFHESDDSDADPHYVPIEEDNDSDNSFGKNKTKKHKAVVLTGQVDETGLHGEKESSNKKKIITRKRSRNPDSWKKNINKKLCQSGQSYKNVKGVDRRARVVKNLKDCEKSCKFSCGKNISQKERQAIHESFWRLSSNEKLHFYNKNTERHDKKRPQTKNKSRRKYSFKYFFHIRECKIRVCKPFFLSTLDISQRRIEYFHSKKRCTVTGVPFENKQGKHPKKVTSKLQKDSVRNHINSISRIDSHYCRRDTKKEYFEASLNLQKLYELYLEWCVEHQIEPIKFHHYRHIFNYEFNIEFQKPKKDRCDTCEEYRTKMKFADLTEDEKARFEKHRISKEETMSERNHDRENNDKETAIICFDMENVFALPKANISCFFYSKKLNTYNLTAHCNINKRAYCAIWCEGTHGRKGNDIASALVCILEKVLIDLPSIKSIVLWSDSCVPQNRNSIMSMALLKFLQEHPNIEFITQKFCEPGHSSIQEIDNIHSQIERKLGNQEIFSPLGLLRLLPTVNRKNPFKVFYMKVSDFKDYQKAAEALHFKGVPFSSVKQLRYDSTLIYHLQYKLQHTGSFTEISVLSKQLSLRKVTVSLPQVKACSDSKECLLPFDKVVHLKKLFKFMPPVDTQFISTFFKQYNDGKVFASSLSKQKKTDTKVKDMSNPQPSTSRRTISTKNI